MRLFASCMEINSSSEHQAERELRCLLLIDIPGSFPLRPAPCTPPVCAGWAELRANWDFVAFSRGHSLISSVQSSHLPLVVFDAEPASPSHTYRHAHQSAIQAAKSAGSPSAAYGLFKPSGTRPHVTHLATANGTRADCWLPALCEDYAAKMPD